MTLSMRTKIVLSALCAAVLLAACATGDAAPEEQAAVTPPAATGTAAAEILPYPFTAEQIRDVTARSLEHV